MSNTTTGLRNLEGPVAGIQTTVTTPATSTQVSTITPSQGNRRYITFAANASLVRTAEMRGVSHLVVPVVALKAPIVIHSMNAATPELVTEEALANLPGLWNNRPVVSEHPNNGLSSANDQSIFESMAFGAMYNTSFADGLLRTEAWLDIERATSLGGDPEALIARANSEEEIEVSIGAFVTIDESQEGTLNGVAYKGAWVDIRPDHLAMLSAGTNGACSNKMGCGAPRLNSANVDGANVTCHGAQQVLTEDQGAAIAALTAATDVGGLDRLSSLINRSAQEGLSDWDIRSLLIDALRRVEPGFDWVEEVFQTDGTAVYSTYIDRFLLYSRTFTLIDNTVTLNDDRQQVAAVTKYEPTPETLTTGGNPSSEANMNGLEKKLIAAGCPLTLVELSALSKERLQALCVHYKAADDGCPCVTDGTDATTVTDADHLVVPVDVAPVIPTVTPDPVIPIVAPVIPAVAPVIPPNMALVPREDLATMQAAAKAYQQGIDDHKAGLIQSIVTAGVNYTANDFADPYWTVCKLQQLAQSLKVETDYSLGSPAIPVVCTNATTTPAPNAWESIMPTGQEN